MFSFSDINQNNNTYAIEIKSSVLDLSFFLIFNVIEFRTKIQFYVTFSPTIYKTYLHCLETFSHLHDEFSNLVKKITV